MTYDEWKAQEPIAWETSDNCIVCGRYTRVSLDCLCEPCATQPADQAPKRPLADLDE